MAKETNELWARALATKSGREYWRGLCERLDTPEYLEEASGEFPVGADIRTNFSRRNFMKLLGASVALAGLEGCTKDPGEKIYPYTIRPEDVILGVPNYYATSMVLDGYATGLLAKSTDGRPTKLEGNPDHPASLGSSGVFAQASVLELYDPNRAKALLHKGRQKTWEALEKLLKSKKGDGAQLRFLLEPQSSPLLASLIARIRQKFPGARFTFYSPLSRQSVFEGAKLVFGVPCEPQYNFKAADVVLSLDADFLDGMPFSNAFARQFADRRRVEPSLAEMNRLYVVEPTPTPTGTLADHRVRLKASEVRAFASAVLSELIKEGTTPPGMPPELAGVLETWGGQATSGEFSKAKELIKALTADLKKSAGKSLVIAGDRQPPEVHALAHLINIALENFDKTVSLREPALLDKGDEAYPLSTLVSEMKAGTVETLIILEGNPSYNAPADLEFSEHLKKVPESIYLSLFENETARDCAWFVPAAHYLESWGDARAYDGTISFIQPLIAPLYGGRSAAEILAVLAGEGPKTPYQLLREFCSKEYASGASATEFERFWEENIQRGSLAGTGSPKVAAEVSWEKVKEGLGAVPAAPKGGGVGEIELIFLPSPNVYDGRFADNGWLLELPGPMTKLTWDNAALISPKTAVEKGIESEDVLEISLKGKPLLNIPALILPGQVDEAISIHLGFGRDGAEAVARGVGANAYTIRVSSGQSFCGEIELRKTGERYPLSLTQTHWSMNDRASYRDLASGPKEEQGEGHGESPDRPLALHATVEEYKKNPQFTAENKLAVSPEEEEKRPPHERKTLLPPLPESLRPDAIRPGYKPEQWAMTIDTSVCTGCSACVVACQAENNIAIVGKESVGKSREMHWLRIDRYFTGSVEDPGVVNQPMLCQHCENAPCEYACPVNATVHSPDGLNEMVYNRCVGTRFCSNNCPYKVRRFNWFDFQDKFSQRSPQIKLSRNPEVTVRERGVMEKCSYCVQRIRNTEIRAQREGRDIEQGEVVTACQQACPTQAIAFGSLRHEDAKVLRWRKLDRSYQVLNDQGTRPRTQYLAKIENPNPDLAKATPEHE